MTANLVAKRFAVAGFDTRLEARDARDALGAPGGRPAADVVDAAAGAEILILMVVSAAQARRVLFEADALNRLAPKAIVCLMATCQPAEVEDLARAVASSGRRFVDCPAFGGVVGARAGSLTIMAAAPATVFAEVDPVLRAMGEPIFHVGERRGRGATVKAINQLRCGVHLAAAPRPCRSA